MSVVFDSLLGLKCCFCRASSFGEPTDKLILGDDWRVELVGFLVLAAGAGVVVVDQKARRLADGSCDFSALALDIRLELSPVLIVVHVARDDEGQSLAAVAGGCCRRLCDVELVHEVVEVTLVVGISEPRCKRSRLLGTDTGNHS